MAQVLIVDEDKCTGCSICELICSMEKQGEYNPRKSFIKVVRNSELDFHIIALDINCDFCNRCVEWCPTKALKLVGWEEAAIARKENKPGVHPAPLLGGYSS